jgi:hypothetical protein
MSSEAKPLVTLRHILLLLVLTLATCWPVLVLGLPDLGNDSLNHAVRAHDLNQHWWQGESYPRWLPEENAGLGGPSFFFYPPLASFASVPFWPLVQASDPHGWRVIGLSCLLSIFLSGVASYFWCRTFASTTAALFGAIIYIVQPYHLAVNLYTRGAAGELWGNVWPPLVLLSIHYMARGSSWAFLGVALSYGLLVFSHLPTTLCFSLVPLAAAWFLSDASVRVRVFLQTGIAMALGIGLAGTFVFPAMLDQKNAHLDEVAVGFSDYHNWWLFQIRPLLDARTRLLLMIAATAALILVALWLLRKHSPSGMLRRTAVFYLGVAAFAIFMASQLSMPIWYVVKPLQTLQLPTRFLQVFMLIAPAFAALSFQYLAAVRWARWTSAAILCSWMTANAAGASQAFSKWRKPAEQAGAYIDNVVNYHLGEYYLWPSTAPLNKHDFPAFAEFVAQNPPRSAVLVSEEGQPSGVASVESWESREAVLRIDAAIPSRLTIRHFYYPGWEARVLDTPGNGSVANITPSVPDGFMTMSVPQGRYRIVVELVPQTWERVGGWVTRASVGLFAVIGLWFAIRVRRASL